MNHKEELEKLIAKWERPNNTSYLGSNLIYDIRDILARMPNEPTKTDAELLYLTEVAAMQGILANNAALIFEQYQDSKSVQYKDDVILLSKYFAKELFERRGK